MNVNDQNKTEIEGSYLTIKLMEELYGVNVTSILQIIDVPPITKVPNTENFVKGVINLRGKIVPVIDLRIKFLMPEIQYDEKTSIVIVKIKNESKVSYIGLIVDLVLEVVNVLDSQIENTPSFGSDIKTKYFLGMAKIDNQVITLLDIEELLYEKFVKE